MAKLKPSRVEWSPEMTDFRTETKDWMPKKTGFRPERADFRPERADFRPERAWGGGRKNEQTNESPMCSTRPCPLQGRCPASHSDLQP